MIYFKEEQRFGRVKLWVILMTTTITLFGGIIYSFYMQLQLRHPVDEKLSDNQLIVLGTFAMIIISLIDWLLLTSKMETVIRNYAIRYRFIPFIWNWNVLKREDIQSFEVRKYNSAKEFKGHGYRRTRQGKSLSVKGNIGLHLAYNSGKKLLLGTQKPTELQKVMEQLMKKGTDHG